MSPCGRNVWSLVLYALPFNLNPTSQRKQLVIFRMHLRSPETSKKLTFFKENIRNNINSTALIHEYHDSNR